MKTCRKCGVTKDIDAFGVHRRRPDGRRDWCKKCINLDARRYRRDNPDAYRASQQRWAQRHPERRRTSSWRTRMGCLFTDAMYAAMLRAQGGGCAACGQREGDRADKRLDVDHDHRTGIVRGILCGPCNRALGHIGDSIERLEQLIEYLRKHQARQ